MKHRAYREVIACIAAVVLALHSFAAMAEDYPSRPIRLVIGAPPGGGMDGVGRPMAEYLSMALKQPVVIDNRGGSGGILASELVAKAKPDGYTLLLIASFHAINPSIYKSLPYNTLKDFTGVSKLAESPLIFVASLESGVRTVPEYLQYASRNPDKVSFATAQMETRLGAEQLLQSSDTKATIVNYKGTGPAVSDVLGGHVPFFVTSVGSVLPFKGTGKLNFVGVAAKKRLDDLPDVPTLAEQGLNVEAGVWYGLVAPADTPRDILDRLSREVSRISEMPEYQSKLRALSIKVSTTASPQDFDAYIRSEEGRFAELVKAAKITPE